MHKESLRLLPELLSVLFLFRFLKASDVMWQFVAIKSVRKNTWG